MYSFLIVTLLLIFSNAEAKSNEKALTQSLLEDYVVTARPVKNDSKAVGLTFGVTLQAIENVDKDSLTGYYWLSLEWVDENLVWGSKDRDFVNKKINNIRLRTEDIWVPDIELFNMMNREALITRDMVLVRDSGSVTWIPPYKITSSCKMDTTWFPFDEQSCDLKFGSWVYNGFDMNLQMASKEMDISSYVRNSKWDLLSASGKLNEVKYECCPEPYQDITFTIRLRRRTLSYLRNVIIPSITITLVSILTLLIPATCPTPRFLSIFLLFILLCFTIPKDLPEVSLLSTMLGWCYFIHFCVLIHSIIGTAIANPLFLQSNSSMNKIIRSIVNRICCGGMDNSKQCSEEQVRYEFAKILDILAISWISVVFLLGIGGNLLSAPYFIVP